MGDSKHAQLCRATAARLRTSAKHPTLAFGIMIMEIRILQQTSAKDAAFSPAQIARITIHATRRTAIGIRVQVSAARGIAYRTTAKHALRKNSAPISDALGQAHARRPQAPTRQQRHNKYY